MVTRGGNDCKGERDRRFRRGLAPGGERSSRAVLPGYRSGALRKKIQYGRSMDVGDNQSTNRLNPCWLPEYLAGAPMYVHDETFSAAICDNLPLNGFNLAMVCGMLCRAAS
jgi:hypothetical protein